MYFIENMHYITFKFIFPILAVIEFIFNTKVMILTIL